MRSKKMKKLFIGLIFIFICSLLFADIAVHEFWSKQETILNKDLAKQGPYVAAIAVNEKNVIITIHNSFTKHFFFRYDNAKFTNIIFESIRKSLVNHTNDLDGIFNDFETLTIITFPFAREFHFYDFNKLLSNSFREKDFSFSESFVDVSVLKSLK
jgi:hypothetical protein